MLDEQRRHHLIDAFITSHGEETAMALADEIFSTDHATKTDLERFATKTDLERFATKDDLQTLTWRFLGGTTAIVSLTTWISHLVS